jgi:hypothetical protein
MTSNYEQTLSLAQALPVSERLRLISELANGLAQSEVPIRENDAERPPEASEQDEDAWWAAFFAHVDANSDENYPPDLSTNKKYMEGYRQW